MISTRTAARLWLALVFTIGAAAARAQSAADFYRGKTITLVIPNAPGGSFDLYGRLVARHLGGVMPGEPAIVPQNMPGAAGMISANWLYSLAPQDGTAMAISVPNVALAQVVGMNEIKYDARKMNWVGRVVSPTATLFVWHTSPTKTLADLRSRQTIVASTGPLSQAEITSNMMNGLVGTKFKIIPGYSGTGDAILALERGEVEAVVMPWTFMKLAHPDWIEQKKVTPLAQYTRFPNADLPGVPSIFDLAETDDQKAVFNLFFGPDEIGQSVMLPPRAPPDRVAAARAAFEKLSSDPEYLADAGRQKLVLTPASAQHIEETIAEAFKATPAQIEMARRYFR